MSPFQTRIGFIFSHDKQFIQ